ncbi:SDR family NAD(P)-dependent oxidoreductase [uncultured Pseudoalteromonas sp.]|uniref:SDR family NAD(P)-dependent oxidoreductase n=1 Tax=uncultured Pseudoalteromonas sp. TaxID=114053 RepID=UPI0025893CE8|nr:SDR family NAD(P)-dependent oxidoreductase [uncultured Pseudoalteromonas sp.]
MQLYIVCGASSEIAKAYFTALKNHIRCGHIVTISRGEFKATFDETANNEISHQHFKTDYSDKSLSGIAKELASGHYDLTQLMIFNGLLHDPEHVPERKLEQISEQHFINSMQTNALLPIRCVALFLTLLKPQVATVICALSARVGSISDNKLGGWFSYRASKAALNMLFKSAAIELSRRYKKCHCVLFHPGTTDTPLSKPFQANVPEGKLFTPEFVAEQLYSLISDADYLQQSPSPAYFDWQGKPIDW